jgi:hypothetical protein
MGRQGGTLRGDRGKARSRGGGGHQPRRSGRGRHGAGGPPKGAFHELCAGESYARRPLASNIMPGVGADALLWSPGTRTTGRHASAPGMAWFTPLFGAQPSHKSCGAVQHQYAKVSGLSQSPGQNTISQRGGAGVRGRRCMRRRALVCCRQHNGASSWRAQGQQMGLHWGRWSASGA